MSFSILFQQLYKPIIHSIKEFGGMFVNTEKWWVAKSPATKSNLRWIGFTTILLTSFILREIQQKNDRIANDIRIRNDRIHWEKKNSFWQFRYLARIEQEIKDYKTLEKNTIENEAKIKKINE